MVLVAECLSAKQVMLWCRLESQLAFVCVNIVCQSCLGMQSRGYKARIYDISGEMAPLSGSGPEIRKPSRLIAQGSE